MIQGIGVDVVALSRVQEMRDKNDFLGNILTPDEIVKRECQREHENYPWILFAVKEALFKALGCGLMMGSLWHDVDLSNTGSINLTGKIKELACQRSVRNIYYTHATSKNYVVAVVILE